VLSACGSAPTPVDVPTGQAQPQPQLAALDAAVAEVDRSRAALLGAPAAVTAAATALDAADEACTTGDRGRAAAARRPARQAVAAVGPALDAAPGQAQAYRAALDGLERAGSGLEPAQRDAVAAAAAAGRDEATAAAASTAAARAAWPAFAALSTVQSTWLDRVSAGWYRTQAEAADAYVVLRRPELARVVQARRALGTADAGRRPATERAREALRAADAALAPLR
jgi:hypothetical protein